MAGTRASACLRAPMAFPMMTGSQLPCGIAMHAKLKATAHPLRARKSATVATSAQSSDARPAADRLQADTTPAFGCNCKRCAHVVITYVFLDIVIVVSLCCSTLICIPL